MSDRRAASLRRYAKAATREAHAALSPDTPAPTLEALVGDPFRLSILDVMTDARLFGGMFGGESWDGWRAVLAGAFALPLTDPQRELFRTLTGREAAPTTPARELWCAVGRRGGKSRIAALVAVYLACFRDHARHLAPGERGTVMVIAADRKQARVALRYLRGFLDSVPALAALIEGSRAEAIDLRNGVSIEVHTASYRSVRGYTTVAVVADECAFWATGEDAANPDEEVFNALRPAMATVPSSLLVAISSPYARRGALYEAHAAHFGKPESDVLVVQAPTLLMNPAVDRRVIERAYAEDEVAAAAEWGGEFRRDVEAFITREALGAAVVPGRLELPYAGDRWSYVGFVDPSGGSQDAMTLAIAHAEGDRVVLDLVREVRPPFSPDEVASAFAQVLRAYGLRDVFGDRYAGVWPTERFQRHGITYRHPDESRSELYAALLPLVMSGRAELLDQPRLRAQFLGLERRTTRNGRDSIDHAPGGHDDLANAAAGALVLAEGSESALATVHEWLV